MTSFSSAQIEKLIAILEGRAIAESKTGADNELPAADYVEFKKIVEHLPKIQYKTNAPNLSTESVPYCDLKAYDNTGEIRNSSTSSTFTSKMFFAGSLLTAAADTATYVLGYGAGVIPAITVSIVAIFVAVPLAIIGVGLRLREYRNLKSDMDVIIENEREIYRAILSNEITNLKRFNQMLAELAFAPEVEKTDVIAIVANINAIKRRLNHFQSLPEDKINIKNVKEDIRKPYASAEMLVNLEVSLSETYLEQIYAKNNVGRPRIQETFVPSLAPLSIYSRKETQFDKVWAYVLPLIYALGTIVTLTCMFGVMGFLATPIGGASALIGALSLAYLYREVEKKFTSLQEDVNYMSRHLGTQNENLAQSREAVRTVKYINDTIREKLRRPSICSRPIVWLSNSKKYIFGLFCSSSAPAVGAPGPAVVSQSVSSRRPS
jgi:hypothetical protein